MHLDRVRKAHNVKIALLPALSVLQAQAQCTTTTLPEIQQEICDCTISKNKGFSPEHKAIPASYAFVLPLCNPCILAYYRETRFKIRCARLTRGRFGGRASRCAWRVRCRSCQRINRKGSPRLSAGQFACSEASLCTITPRRYAGVQSAALAAQPGKTGVQFGTEFCMSGRICEILQAGRSKQRRRESSTSNMLK